MVPLLIANFEMSSFLIAMPDLTGVYIISLIVGGGLIAFSTILGGHGDGGFETDFSPELDAHVGDVDVHVHVDVDADADVDIGHDVDLGDEGDVGQGADGGHEVAVGHAASGPFALANWFSVKFVVYFAAMFGGVGLTLDKLADMTAVSVLVYALIGGFIIGQGAHQFLRLIRKTGGNSQVSVRDFINQTGRITIRVQPPKRGEVAVRIGDRKRFVPAVSRRPDDEFKVGDKVVIVGFNAGTVEVISKREHEFTTDGQPGGDV